MRLVGVSRLIYPFFAGLLLSRLKGIIPVPRGGFVLTSALVAATLAMPYFAPASAPWVNGLYEAFVVLFVFPLIVSLGAGSSLPGGRGARLCKFLGEISYPLYVTHFPLVCVHKAWAMNHASVPFSQHCAVVIAMYLLAVVNAYAALKLYDLPIRAWLGRKNATPPPSCSSPE